MPHPEIEKYIASRYMRWLDYSTYHCSKSGLVGQEIDVLNEVMLSVLTKDCKKLQKLYEAKKGQYRELDFFVLRMIKLNITSPTSPYRSRNKDIPADESIDFRRLPIPDTEYEENDIPGVLFYRFKKVRDIFESLNLSEIAKNIFSHRFINDLPFSEWKGPETTKQCYEIYSHVIKLIKDKLNGRCLF